MSGRRQKGDIGGSDGHRVDRRGCAICGATIYITISDGEDIEKVEIYVGAMDEPKSFRPAYEIFDVHRPDWLPSLSGVPTCEAFKED